MIPLHSSYDPMVNQGNAIGFWTAAIIVAVAIVVGGFSLIRFRDRSKIGDSFADDFIPDRKVVGNTLASKPDLRDKS